eukprot:scaffold83799_cov44-Attheya_sp.AAC.2
MALSVLPIWWMVELEALVGTWVSLVATGYQTNQLSCCFLGIVKQEYTQAWLFRSIIAIGKAIQIRKYNERGRRYQLDELGHQGQEDVESDDNDRV